jgi:hypothetical protein
MNELRVLKASMLNCAKQTYAFVPQKIIFYIICEIDKRLGKEGRLAFLRWLFDRPEIMTSHLDQYPQGLTNSEAEALRLWAQPYKGDWEGAKWKLLNQDFIHHLDLFQQEVMGQLALPLEAK